MSDRKMMTTSFLFVIVWNSYSLKIVFKIGVIISVLENLRRKETMTKLNVSVNQKLPDTDSMLCLEVGLGKVVSMVKYIRAIDLNYGFSLQSIMI